MSPLYWVLFVSSFFRLTVLLILNVFLVSEFIKERSNFYLIGVL